jgi:glycosyltransferase involved in cell wall biosynthesis
MHLGMPVVALATTEAHEAVPPGTGYCSTDVGRLTRGLRELMAEPQLAWQLGDAARAHALRRYGLDRFLVDWDATLAAATDSVRRPAVTTGRS